MGLSVSANLNTLLKSRELLEFVNQFLLMDKQLTGRFESIPFGLCNILTMIGLYKVGTKIC
jgi:hypothetical protein